MGSKAGRKRSRGCGRAKRPLLFTTSDDREAEGQGGVQYAKRDPGMKSHTGLDTDNTMLSKRKVKVLTMANTFNPSTRRQRQVRMIFIKHSKTTRATCGETSIIKKQRQAVS